VTERAAHQAIEIAVMDYFKVKACIVDLEAKNACILFNSVSHQKWIQQFNGVGLSQDLKEIPINIPLGRLPRKISKTAQPILENLLAQQRHSETYREFRRLQGRVVQGTIAEERSTGFAVSLKGGVGNLHHRDCIERDSYDLASSHLFKVKRVRRQGDTMHISLTRRAKAIPKHVLCSKFPQYKFHCYRRIPGAESWIKTTAPRFRWGLFMAKDIRRALAWEYLHFFTS